MTTTTGRISHTRDTKGNAHPLDAHVLTGPVSATKELEWEKRKAFTGRNASFPRPVLTAILTIMLSCNAVAQQQAEETEFSTDAYGYPTWEIAKHMPNDVFTFARVQYQSYGGRGHDWRTDYPDADRNFSYRLQQLTSLQVSPDPVIVTLMDRKELAKYPYIYVVEPGDMYLSQQEIENLRHYLLNGGFMHVDDFWGDREWNNFHDIMKKVFPDRQYKELDISHPIFHIVFDLNEKPQVPAINDAWRGRSRGITWQTGFGESAREVHYRAYFDDNGRMVCIIGHNTDLGDGWEREGIDPWYFTEFSEKRAYPMGINIVVYAMTH